MWKATYFVIPADLSLQVVRRDSRQGSRKKEGEDHGEKEDSSGGRRGE